MADSSRPIFEFGLERGPGEIVQDRPSSSAIRVEMEAGKDQEQSPQQEMAMFAAAEHQKKVNIASSYKIEGAVVKNHKNDTGLQIVHSPDADSKLQCENPAPNCSPVSDKESSKETNAYPDAPSTILAGVVGTECSIEDRQPDASVDSHESVPLELKCKFAEAGDNLCMDLELGHKGRMDKLDARVFPGEMDAYGGKECRVCHLNLDKYHECGEAMYLGCACKADLAVAHRRCAEAWFKLKGNSICEICGVMAKNVTGMEDKEFMNEYNAQTHPTPPPQSGYQRWWNRLPLFNFLIAIIIAAILLPWIFHFHLFA